jgi:hypothetical protein
VGASAPRIGPVDELLDEWLAVRQPALGFGTPAARRASKTVWMTTNAKPYGLNPDDPAVIAAIDLVRWELSLCT